MAKVPSTDTQEELSCALAEALTMWNNLEGELSLIFYDCLITPTLGKTSRVYWSTTSFQSRLRMVDAVVAGEFGEVPEVMKPWTALRAAAESLVKWRNKFAHGTLMAFQWRHKGELQKETCFIPYSSLVLVEKFEDMPKLDARPKDRIDVKMIRASIAEFRKLTKELEVFRHDLFERLNLSAFLQFYHFMRTKMPPKNRELVMAEFVKLYAKFDG